MANRSRPTSPHLQVYRLPLTAILSISFRITGAALVVGTLVLVAWLVAAASGPEAFATMQGLLGSIFGQILLFGWSVALFYHLCGGLRHLWWDTGNGLELDQAYMSGWVAVAGTVILTALAWVIAYMV